MAVTTALFFIGIGGVAISPHVNFLFLLAAVVVVGTACSFGQQVILGQLGSFEPEAVGGWSAGTGFAGITGSLAMIGFAAADLSILQTFLAILPTSLIYGFAYFVILRPPPPAPEPTFIEPAPVGERTRLLSPNIGINREPDAPSDSPAAPFVIETRVARVWRCTKLVLFLATNLMIVYFAEYVVSVGCADLAEPKGGAPKHANFFQTHTYVVLAFCYQLGVFISRSSLRFFKVTRVEILSLLQVGNLVFWILDDMHKWMSYQVQFAAMVFCGLLGGTSYVNTFYLINTSTRIPDPDRKLTIYIAAVFISVGICLAAAFVLIMDATFMHAYLPSKTSKGD
eukprot:c3797_g1_i1.p1 GENE.c3797_g1_i1~~c3797_g1_i1.p1  ORF type:complete len:340 (+),score=71.72 c3797_g1_i1:265-1284(+)